MGGIAGFEVPQGKNRANQAKIVKKRIRNYNRKFRFYDNRKGKFIMFLKDYTDFTLRKPPKNVKVMVLFTDESKDICYIDDWGIIHGEEVKIIRDRVPAYWKKIEKDEMGDYKW